jgi:uncharacterized membrane protein YkvA (DUF1232 family)
MRYRKFITTLKYGKYMKLLSKLKEKAKQLKREIIVIYYAYQEPKTPLLPKLIILFTLGYALSPIDLIPDFIPVLGYIDDLLIIPALIALSIRLIPKEVIERVREKAINEPLRLKDNWFFAVAFVLTWIAMITGIVLLAIKFR